MPRSRFPWLAAGIAVCASVAGSSWRECASPLRPEIRSEADGAVTFRLAIPDGATVQASCPCVHAVLAGPQEVRGTVDCRRLPRYVVPGLHVTTASGSVFVELPCE